MVAYSLKAFTEKNHKCSKGMLLSFLDVEAKEPMISDIIIFLNCSNIGEEIELTDHFIIRENDVEVLILNETTEMFALNREERRVRIDVDVLLFVLNQKMSYGLDQVKTILKTHKL
ncbi:hypothetical protein ABGV42_23705 [Paenibacillus pabuli]|uniref:hypothetical protein n=1 Tax=Paenibacillus pabuli TaxID=1472 RepID=UPI003242BC23